MWVSEWTGEWLKQIRDLSLVSPPPGRHMKQKNESNLAYSFLYLLSVDSFRTR